MKKKIITASVVIALIALAYFSLYTVDEREMVVITQFGKPVRVVKESGLHMKLPGFLQTVNSFDKRTKLLEIKPAQLLLEDKNPLIISAYALWKITDPLLFLQAVGDETNGKIKLADMINAKLGITIGDYKIKNIINIEAQEVKLQEIAEKIKNESNENAHIKYGVEIVKVGINRVAYPSVVATAVYQRMQSERKKEADKIRAEGNEKASNIKAEAEKEAAGIVSKAEKESIIISGNAEIESMKLYSEAYGKNRDFFEFMKWLETYEKIIDSKTTLILSTDSEIFKYLQTGKINSRR